MKDPERLPFGDTYLGALLLPRLRLLWRTAKVASIVLVLVVSALLAVRSLRSILDAPVQATPPRERVAAAAPAPLRPEKPSQAVVHPPPRKMTATTDGKSRVPSPSPTPVPVRRVTVPAGTRVVVRLAELVATSHNQPGDTASVMLVDDLQVGDHLAARADIEGTVRVEEVRRGSREQSPLLTLSLESLHTPGEWMRLTAEPVTILGIRQSKAKRLIRGIGGAAKDALLGKQAAKAERGILIGAAIKSEVMVRDDVLELPTDTLLQFTLAEDATVTLRR